jgi:hypothetical protein
LNRDEEVAAQYLSHIGFNTIQYEPDGNVPPDFLCDGRVAVEVRRLNQTFDAGKGAKGLEEVDIPLREKIRKLLPSLGPPTRGQCWFVFYSFRRPVPKWKVLRSQLEMALKSFMNLENPAEVVFELADRFEVHIFPSSHKLDTFFIFGGSSDDESGGWVLAEMNKNVRLCVAEKTEKISKFRTRYKEWWLILIDLIGYGLDESDQSLFRDQVAIAHSFDKVILIDPRNHMRFFEI